MKIKNLILLPALSMILASCASVSSADSSFYRIDDPISSSHKGEHSSDDYNSEYEPISSELPISAFQFSVDGVNTLRNPSELTHSISYEDYSSESFINFRNKMKAFSSKLSDIFVKKYFAADDNFVMSPLSIDMCLGLAMRSAGGETRNEILAALDMDYETFNANYKLYYDYLYHSYKNNMGFTTSQLLLTNSIWVDDDVTLKDSGLDALRDDYYCYSYDVDFDKNNDNANQAIKEFINYHTRGLINPDIKLSTATLFVLMNILYVKDIWNELGSDLLYAPITYKFTNSGGSQSEKRLLSGYGVEGKPIVTDDYSCFYTSTLSGYRLYFVKPNEGKNLKDVFNKDTMNYVLDKNNIIIKDDEKMELYETNCIFPEFSVSGDFELSKVFHNDLGIDSMFNPATCNMSGLTDREVYCSEVRHLTKLEVNKQGIEGAAVTYMAYAGAADHGPYKVVQDTFVVDKEFGFILTYNDGVVFSGIVNNIDK